MALVHRERHVLDWPDFGWPERWRQMFEPQAGWLKVEEFHEGDTLVVRAEIPDIDPDKDVEITTAPGVVRIHAHREQKTEDTGKRGYRSEFRYGEFTRDIVLPEGVAKDDVKATYKDGILEVRVPCPAARDTTPEKVPVTRG